MREKNIIQDLLSSKSFIRVEEFASRYLVSARTISNDIKFLMQISKSNGFEILLKRKEGYYIKVLDEVKLKAYMEEDSYDTPLYDRIDAILMHILLQSSYVTQDELAQTLQISKSMIKLDMNKVEERLQQNALQLDRKAHYGICVQGDLQVRKEMLLKLVEANNFVEEYIDELIDDENMKQVDKILIEKLRIHELSTNYAEMIKLDRYLKISIACNKQGITPTGQIEESANIYQTIAQEIKVEIQKISKLSLSDVEVSDIARYIHLKTKPKTVHLEYDEQLKKDILSFLKQSDEEYQTSFLKDESFLQSLFAHVSLLVDRLHQSISFDNPLVKEISAKYPEVFNLSIKFSEMLETKYKVKATQDEIGFIATHFAAHMEKEHRNRLRSFNKIAIVCSSGGGSAFLIKLKMETLFTDAKIETFSFMEMQDLKAFAPDIIFTIKELHESFNVPIVLIKELLNDEDIQKIKHMFEFCGVEKKQSIHDNGFAKLFHSDAFWHIEKGDYTSILDEMASQLERLAFAKEGYRDYVLKREEVLSTVYMNGIAIPHPLEMCSDEDMIAVGIIQHDVKEEGKNVKIVFMVNLKKGTLELHQNISRILFNLMNDEKLVEKIHKSSSFEDFMKHINTLD